MMRFFSLQVERWLRPCTYVPSSHVCRYTITHSFTHTLCQLPYLPEGFLSLLASWYTPLLTLSLLVSSTNSGNSGTDPSTIHWPIRSLNRGSSSTVAHNTRRNNDQSWKIHIIKGRESYNNWEIEGIFLELQDKEVLYICLVLDYWLFIWHKTTLVEMCILKFWSKIYATSLHHNSYCDLL